MTLPTDGREAALLSLAENLGLTPYEAVFLPATFDSAAALLGSRRLVAELSTNERLQSYLGQVVRKAARSLPAEILFTSVA